MFKTDNSVLILLLSLLQHLLASPGAVPFILLALDLCLDLLLAFLKTHDFRVLLLDVRHDLPLHLSLRLQLCLGLPHLVIEVVGFAFQFDLN